MNTQTKIFLKKKFKEYYQRHRVPAPAEIEKREFGTGTLDRKIAVRHKSFKSGNELNNYLRKESPYFISYSAAYYEFPQNQPMEAKNWRGADLVFDIDIDMKFLNYKAMDAAKWETQKLIDFLVDDFSFSSHIRVYLFKDRGYCHCFSHGTFPGSRNGYFVQRGKANNADGIRGYFNISPIIFLDMV